jgi:hypothetical protein
MYFYKLHGQRPRHRFDLQLIERHCMLSASDRDRAHAVFVARRSRSGEIRPAEAGDLAAA